MSLWLRLVSLVVPRYRRGEWLSEWRGEIGQHAGAPGGNRAARSLGLGAVSHAFWLRRLEWSFTIQDFRYALRLASRNRGFAVVVVSTLAIGIGAATAMFSVVHGVLLKPLPYGEPDRLVWMYGSFRINDSASVSPLDFIDYRERNTAFEALGAMMISPSGVTVAGASGPERLRASTITSGLIAALGVPPAIGRDFTRDEERQAGPQSIVISHDLWQQRFGGDPGALGKALTVDGRPRTIVGVMPPGFRLPYDPFVDQSEPVDLFAPFPFDADEARVRAYHFLRVIGRLRPGVSIEAAQSHMDGIARDLEAAYPATNETWRLRLVPLREQLVGNVRETLLVMMAAVLLVLVIACANVAGLLLARAASRHGEVAVRRALGASRARVVRQFLMEGLVFAAAGSAAGLLLAWWAVGLVKRVSPGNLPRIAELSLDPAVVLFALGAGIGTTLLFALLPALQTAGRAEAASLRDGARTAGSRRASGLRGTLVAAQVAMSTTLLIGAGLLVRSFVELSAVDTGFAAENVLIARVSVPPQRYESTRQVEQFYTQLTERVATAPGVESAALTSAPPLAGGNDISTFAEGQKPVAQADRRFSQVRWIQGRYFDAAGIPIVKGRALDDKRETPSSAPAVVISESMAASYFPGVDPLGRRLVADFRTPVVAEIVGVAGDARIFGQAEEAPDMIYLSARQFPINSMSVMVRTTTPPSGFVPLLRGAVREIDPTLALGPVQTMESLLRDSVARPRFRTGLIGSFAVVALTLTIVGLYGTLAYSVSQRTREIGIRFALGAQARSVMGLVVRQGTWFVLLGGAAGMLGALAATRLLEDMLFQVTPRDARVFIGVPLVIAAVAALAMIAPARRASKLDPVRALRS
jgi:putative ABC transport system permease protein